LWLYLATGALVWAFARSETYHIGLSYIIYGLVSFVFWTGVFRRSIQSIALAVVVMFFYSGMFVGIVPSAENLARNISWESHLLGGIVGIYAAYRYRHEYEDDEFSDTPPSVKEEDKETFFEQNTFEATKWEREEAERRRHIAENQSPENPFKDWFSNHT
jgi:hypothetical protein